MYVAPDIVRSAARPATGTRSVVTTFSAMICLGVLFFLFAATIILALIPIYISKKNVTPNPNAYKSKIAQLLAKVRVNNPGRRKRQSASESQIIGNPLNGAGLKQLHDALRPSVQANGGQDIEIISAFFGYINSNKKKRFALSRQRRAVSLVLTVFFRIIFPTSCPLRCQNNRGTGLRRGLQSLNGTNPIVLNNIAVIIGGVEVPIDSLVFVSIEYVTEIYGGLGPNTEGPIPVVFNTTTAVTTTVAATVPIAG